MSFHIKWIISDSPATCGFIFLFFLFFLLIIKTKQQTTQTFLRYGRQLWFFFLQYRTPNGLAKIPGLSVTMTTKQRKQQSFVCNVRIYSPLGTIHMIIIILTTMAVSGDTHMGWKRAKGVFFYIHTDLANVFILSLSNWCWNFLHKWC